MVNYKRLYREECEYATEFRKGADAAWQHYDELRTAVLHAFSIPCDDLCHSELIDFLTNERVIFSVSTLDRSITSELGLSAAPIIDEVIAWLKE